MSDEFREFWGEPIDSYTDKDGLEDGFLIDVSVFDVKFNGYLINRATSAAAAVLNLRNLDGLVVKKHLEFIAEKSEKDGEGIDAWGIFEPDSRLGDAKFWLIYNETGGYTLMLPSDY